MTSSRISLQLYQQACDVADHGPRAESRLHAANRAFNSVGLHTAPPDGGNYNLTGINIDGLPDTAWADHDGRCDQESDS